MSIISKQYYMITIDPLHIGSGGISLGKVDNPITLDTATHLPKIPGTGISGAVKYFTDLELLNLAKNDLELLGRKKAKEEGFYCASTRGKCGNDCLICYTFGYTNANDAEGKSSKGVLAFCDAHLLLFPMFSAMYGRIWVTSDSIFNKNFNNTLALSGFKAKTNLQNSIQGHIEVGGILFKVEAEDKKLPESAEWNNFAAKKEMAEIVKKVIIVSEEQFAFLVQKNLEQRTCVAIDPETGAAKPQALFTFEAVPEKAVFTFQVNMNEYKKDKSPFTKYKEILEKYQKASISQGEEKKKNLLEEIRERCKKEIKKGQGQHSTIPEEPAKNEPVFSPLDLIQLGFQGIKEFGMGGMNTRGFGRLEILEILKK